MMLVCNHKYFAYNLNKEVSYFGLEMNWFKPYKH